MRGRACAGLLRRTLSPPAARAFELFAVGAHMVGVRGRPGLQTSRIVSGRVSAADQVV
jgi:hypothetical protein